MSEEQDYEQMNQSEENTEEQRNEEGGEGDPNAAGGNDNEDERLVRYAPFSAAAILYWLAAQFPKKALTAQSHV